MGVPVRPDSPMYELLHGDKIDEFNERRAAGENLKLQGLDLRAMDLRGLSTDGISLAGSYLRGTDLRGLDLSNVGMEGAWNALLAQKPLLPDEDPEVYADHRIRLARELNPIGYFEELLAAQITDLLWRLRRVVRIEAAVFEAECNALQVKLGEAEFERKNQQLDVPQLAIEQAKRSGTFEEKSRDEIIADPAWIGSAFINSLRHGALEKLSHYETRKLRELEKLLAMLGERQQQRLNEPITDFSLEDDQRSHIPGRISLGEAATRSILCRS